MSNSESRRRAAAMRQDLIRGKSAHLDGPESRRFVADVMLGRLAKWLRIAGFDVLYSNRFSDDDLVAVSRHERRILLSRDTRLLVRKAVSRFIYLESSNVQEQIRQVFRLTGTQTLPNILTRCLVCNEPLADVPHDSVRSSVPPFVFATQAHFKSCPRCRKVYWAGTHRQAVLRTLQSLLGNSSSSERERC